MTVAPTLSAPAAPLNQPLHNILSSDVKVKVSSGTSKDAKSILDGSAETCWTSDNLPPNSDPTAAHYLLSFKLPQSLPLSQLHSLSLTFAGGFSPMSFNIVASQDGKTWSAVVGDLFPKDTNAKQYFNLGGQHLDEHIKEASWLRFELNGSTDDYGRVTIYQAEIFTA